MLLLTLIQDDSKEYIIDEIRNARNYFKLKNATVGISESLENNLHIIKVYCDDENFNENFQKMFNLYIGNVLFKVVIKEFCKKNVSKYLSDNFYFLRGEDIKEVKNMIIDVFENEDNKIDDNMIYYMNRKNEIIKKIILCLEENNEVNIKGFLTFRMKEMTPDLESIIDKIVEKFMVEKEYNEFIKLLKYFVDVQESKINEVNILIDKDGNYVVRDEFENDILSNLVNELYDSRISSKVSSEDLIISGLITSAPKKIVIHCVENSRNKELIETIKNVFGERVQFCNNCSRCIEYKNNIKI
ncbi:putative sporulation protein YtxC [Clostridium butanoliproducens]|uniref:putative sporulation protein YtxC n=1 Tax=Clostridium butanoliproducens TaxID=2991837 RepID=UPI0024B92C04|nr:putative sporulation protein YtxC [Clostridium butanoliproducens]MDU1347865.1 putative sporulation protein YtxC [Clostridium argentinense]